MSYTLEFEFKFESEANEEEAMAWLNDILSELPEGATGKIKRDPRVIDVNDLGVEHEGQYLTVSRGADGHDVQGRIEQVYPRGGKHEGAIVVLDGKAYELLPYEVATITD